MRALWFLPFACVLPAAAQFAAPAAGARAAVEEFSAARDARQDAALAVFGLSSGTVEVVCAAKPCPEGRRREVLSSLSGMLARMPRLLAPARPPKLVWEDAWSGEADGTTSGDGEVTLYAPPGKDMAPILAHELGHVLEKDAPKTVQEFLDIRHETPAYRDALAAFWVEVWRSRGPDDDGDRPLSAQARQRLALLRLPRRHQDDLHAAKSGREYWAVALELVYIEWRAGRSGPLDAFMSAGEESWLRSRF